MDKTKRSPAKARKKTHFWNWDSDEDTGVRTLYLDGTIADESWWDDEITPRMFKDELMSGDSDIVVWINSPGGDCVAASQIYAMLMDYKGKVTVKIDGMRRVRRAGADEAPPHLAGAFGRRRLPCQFRPHFSSASLTVASPTSCLSTLTLIAAPPAPSVINSGNSALSWAMLSATKSADWASGSVEVIFCTDDGSL